MIPFWRWPGAGWTVLRTFGIRGAILRATHEGRRATGAFRAVPHQRVMAGGRPLFRLASSIPEAARSSTVTRGERVLGGTYEAFGWQWRDLPRDPDGWRRHPATGGQFPLVPWWRVPHLHPVLGDIKQVWEPARFAWAYDLVRGWAVTGDPRYPAAFHRHLAEWAASSPPYLGPHWACGQETAIRAIAILHAEANLPVSGGEAGRIADVLCWSGERIADAIGYAESQRNNHALSEGAGLVALGVRFAGTHPDADRWRRLGQRVLERAIQDQFEDDGWYIQHSFNYLRLALEQCTAAQTALRSSGDSLSAASRERVAAGAALLAAVIGPDGSVPNHGPNDGANVIPRSSAPYADFRPALTAASVTFGLPMPADIAADTETVAWCGVLPAPVPARQDGVQRGRGWVVARVGKAHIFLRAGRYRSRPGHLDPLQLDVRFGGAPVVVDPGTFLYNGPPPWRNGLVSAAVHNGPISDDKEPGLRGPRFLWYAWPSARVQSAEWDGSIAHIRATRPGGIERRVVVGADIVTVTDRVRAGVRARVRWLLHPQAEPTQVETADAEIRTPNDLATPGWYSPHYAERIGSRYIDAVRSGSGVHEIVTTIRPAPPIPQPPRR